MNRMRWDILRKFFIPWDRIFFKNVLSQGTENFPKIFRPMGPDDPKNFPSHSIPCAVFRKSCISWNPYDEMA